MRARAILATLAVVTACGTTDPADEGLRFAAKGPAFEPGGTITVELSNGSTGTVGYNFCQRFWERKVGLSWERFEEFAICTPAFAQLPAGATAEETLGVPYGLVPGTYRVGATLLVDGKTEPILSNAFEIELGTQR